MESYTYRANRVYSNIRSCVLEGTGLAEVNDTRESFEIISIVPNVQQMYVHLRGFGCRIFRRTSARSNAGHYVDLVNHFTCSVELLLLLLVPEAVQIMDPPDLSLPPLPVICIAFPAYRQAKKAL